jgi:hypothetical protein
MVYLAMGVRVMAVNMSVKRLFCLFFFLSFFPAAHAGRPFDELVKALQERYVQMRLAEVQKKYYNKNVEGRAYITNISSDVSGRRVVTLSTEKSFRHPKAVTVVVYLRPYFDKNITRFKVGDRVYCFGPFKEFRMNSIIIEGGFIK